MDEATAGFLEENFIFMVLGLVGIIAIVFGSFASVINRSTKERSRREIAAYIAEGSMTAADGERLMKAGPSEDE